MGWTRRTPLPETTMASRVRARGERSSRDSGQRKFESALVPLLRYLRSDRGSRRNKRMPARKCRTWKIRATLFATRAPDLDKGNRVSLQIGLRLADRGLRCLATISVRYPQ